VARDQRIAGWVAFHGIGEHLADGLFQKRQHGAARVAFHDEDYTLTRVAHALMRAASPLLGMQAQS
jgi:hypothetical protein